MNAIVDFIMQSLFAGRYFAIFIGTVIEGPIVTTATGFLYHLGYFKLIPAYCLLILGDLTADITWYYIGYYGMDRVMKKLGHFIGLDIESQIKIKALFNRHDSKILFISKLTMGFGFSLVTLMTAGMARVPIRKFIWYNFLGGLIWVALLMTLGYFMGNLYSIIARDLRFVFIIAMVLLVVGMMYGFSQFIKKQIKALK